MPITTTSLTVTPTWSDKKLTVEGSVSVRESVTLRLVGCADDTSVVFKMSSENGRVDYAKFPNEDGDAWTEDGDDLVGTLNLNTALLVAAFASLEPEDRVSVFCTVASATNSNLYAKGCKQVGNWMEDTDDPVAYSTPLADAIDELEEDFAAHTHDGTDAPKVAHGDLTEIGVNTHDAIDAALAANSITLNAYGSAISTNASNILANTAAISVLDGTVVKKASFAVEEIEDITVSTATVKKLAAKVNEILAILRG